MRDLTVIRRTTQPTGLRGEPRDGARAGGGLRVSSSRQALELRETGGRPRKHGMALRTVAIAEEMCGSQVRRNGTRAPCESRGPPRGRGILAEDPLADFLVGANRCAEALRCSQALAEIDGAHRPVDPIWRLQARLLQAHCAGGSAGGEAFRLAGASLRPLPAVDVDLDPTARSLLFARPARP